MIRRSARLGRAALALAIALAIPSGALAQAGDVAAEALFEEGVAKLDAGDYPAACPLLERAIAASSSEALGGMLALAECYEKSNRPASAWALYRKVAARAGASGQSSRAAEAESGAARLEPTLPKVRFIAPKDAPPDLRARFGSETIPSKVWDVALPVDPGQLEIKFEADGFVSETVRVVIPSGPSTTDVTAPQPLTMAGVLESRKPELPDEPELPPWYSPPTWTGVSGIIVGATSSAVALAALPLIIDAKSKWDDAVASDCPDGLNRCTSLEGINEARRQGDAATVILGVGLGGLAVGAGMYIGDILVYRAERRREHEEQKRKIERIKLGIAPGGVSATMRFGTW